MLIQFKKPQCSKHRAVLQYVCRTPNCPCQIRLCLKCLPQHDKKYANTEYIKEENYIKKIEIESQIISNQYEFLKKMPLGENEKMKGSKNNENIKLVETIMRKAGQQKNQVFKLLEQIDFNHKDTKNKLNRYKNDHVIKYLEFMKSKDLLNMAINLNSNQGLHNLRVKYNRCNSIIKSFQQFIEATKLYGNTFSSFLKYLLGQETLFLFFLQKIPTNIHAVKCISRPHIFFENQEGQKLKFREKRDQKLKISKQHNRSQQFLGPTPGSGKKISLVTPRKRSCSSDKQN